MNKVRQKKLMWVMATLFGAIIAVVLVIYAVGQQTDYYFDPTAISQGKAPEDTRIRAGGMVVRGSVERDSTDPLNVKLKSRILNPPYRYPIKASCQIYSPKVRAWSPQVRLKAILL